MPIATIRNQSIVVSPPKVDMVISTALIVFGAGALAHAFGSLQSLGGFDLGVFGVGGATFLAVGIDVVQRRYVFEKKRTRMRVLFWWRTAQVPKHPRMAIGKRGQLLLLDETGKTVIAIPKPYYRQGDLKQRLERFYQIRDVNS